MAPVLKRTSRQTHAANRLASIQSFWRTLDSTQKGTFTSEAVNYPRVDSLGNVYTMQGINLQQSANTAANAQGEPLIDSMPAPAAAPSISFDFAAIDISLQAMDIITNPQVLPSTHSMLVYATRPVSPGQLSNENLFVYLGVVLPSTDTANYNWYQVYKERFGIDANNVGQIFGVALQFISQVTFLSGLSIHATSEPITA